MKIRKLVQVSLLVLAFASQCREAEGFFESVMSAFSRAYNMRSCVFQDCCHCSIKYNKSGLEWALTKRLHGQPLVKYTVVRLLTEHIENDNPKKALVLSLHGWAGSGKTFVARLIAEHIFELGPKSQFVHHFVPNEHFPCSHSVTEYQENLCQWLHDKVSKCEKSMFIFDHMDMMPDELLDAIKPYLDTYLHIDGVNYRKAIFLFLSTTAGDKINQHVLENWEAGGKREDLTHNEMEYLIVRSAFNDEGGLWHSSLLENDLILDFIPFLPLERHHVKQCIIDYLMLTGRGHISKKQFREILNELQYFPKDKNIFSMSGCSQVAQKVELILS